MYDFSKEEIRDIKAQLFRVNTSFHCINPAPLSWAKAYQEQQIALMKRKRRVKSTS